MRTAIWLFAFIALAGLIYLLYERKIPVSCQFTSENSETILPGIRSGLSFEGHIEPPTKGDELDLRSVEGTLRWSDGKTALASEARGSVFTDENGAVLALHLSPSGPARGFRTFSVATLNQAGSLDEDREKAFVWRLREEKLKHPVSYACVIGG